MRKNSYGNVGSPWIAPPSIDGSSKIVSNCKRPVWISWRLDETYIRVKGQWRYLYRAVDKSGQTIDFLLMGQRDEQVAMRFLTKAIRGYNEVHGTNIVIRQVKYLNNIVEQDHRSVKRVTHPMLGFKSFEAAQCILSGIELMHMLRKGQLAGGVEQGLTAAEQFYTVAA
jgi:putative transposase